MKAFCEMKLTDYFKLSTGHVALVGYISPDSSGALGACKAALYIGDSEIRLINIVGEDQFLGVNKEVQKGRRSVRTNDDITNELKSAAGKEIKLAFYKN